MKTSLPSYDLTPSRAFRRPEKDTPLLPDLPVTDSLPIKIPSISSKRIIDWLGLSLSAELSPSSSISSLAKFR